MPQANLQFAPGADLEKCKSEVQALPGVRRVRQVFPDESDPELVRMFVVDVDAASQDAVLRALGSRTDVADVELTSARRVRPPQSSRDSKP